MLGLVPTPGAVVVEVVCLAVEDLHVMLLILGINMG